jgi:hypothetical protein
MWDRFMLITITRPPNGEFHPYKMLQLGPFLTNYKMCPTAKKIK